MIQYCARTGLEFTRGRPRKKNDQAWIEQKNGAVIGHLVGYERFEGVAHAKVLARPYAAARLYVNIFQPSFKLESKERIGSKVKKVYYPPATPAQRFERTLGLVPRSPLGSSNSLRISIRSGY